MDDPACGNRRGVKEPEVTKGSCCAPSLTSAVSSCASSAGGERMPEDRTEPVARNCVPVSEEILDNRVGSAREDRGEVQSRMVALEGGRFLMGTEDADGFAEDGEGPVREITLDPFWIDRYPV